ncbi:MAG: hypothetical protein MK066_11585 [Crocinitomicaceae bacterium]|nr:hypothetical protein [Crocinitomicaceae bacterium]
MAVNEKIETEYISFHLLEGVLTATYKPSVITLSVAKEVVRIRKEYCKNKTYPHLVMDYGIAKINKDARDYLSSDEGTEGIAAAGLITNSVFKRTMVNFFLKVTRPKIPVKMFSGPEEAREWLQKWVRE